MFSPFKIAVSRVVGLIMLCTIICGIAFITSRRSSFISMAVIFHIIITVASLLLPTVRVPLNQLRSEFNVLQIIVFKAVELSESILTKLVIKFRL